MKLYTFMGGSLIAEVITTADSVLEMIVLVAAAIAALGIIWAKGVVPAAHFGRRAIEGLEIVRGLPDFQRRLEQRLEVIEGALYGSGMIESLPIRRRGDRVRGKGED